jgi:hypothetical protein
MVTIERPARKYDWLSEHFVLCIYIEDKIKKVRLNTDFRQPFMFHQKIHNFASKPDDQYCFFKKYVFKNVQFMEH